MELESRFTKPRDDCPHPEHWHSLDSDSTEHEVSELLYGMIRGLQPELVVETGTAWGQTAYFIGRALKHNGHGELITSEIIPERVEASRQKCQGLPVHVVQQRSLDVAPPMDEHGETQQIDFLWIDSAGVGLREAEVRYYRQFASVRCVVGMHDTGSGHHAGKELKHLYEDGILQKPLDLSTPRGISFARYWL